LFAAERRRIAMVRFHLMTEDAFEVYKERLIEDYAKTLSKNLRRSLEFTLAASAEQINGLLKEGIYTKDHYVYDVVDALEETVGVLWVNVKPEEQLAFIYDIEMRPEHQGKGYGKATLAELERIMKEKGVSKIGLNVFADNPVAIKLYKGSGYGVTNMNMVKEI
jgi:ribosomal protein S18 acetylase RimI-like enzyme